jgi:hypothetical protein
VSGSNFLPDELVVVKFRGMVVGAKDAGPDGRVTGINIFVRADTVPGPAGTRLTGARSGRTAFTTVLIMSKVTPVRVTLTIFPSVVQAGHRVVSAGAGYRSGEVVLLRFRGAVLAAVAAGPQGSFSNVSFRVPSSTPSGTFMVIAFGSRSGRMASAALRVMHPAAVRVIIWVAPGSVQRHTMVTLYGRGFFSHEFVLIRLRGTVVEAVKTFVHGTFQVSFRLPMWAGPGTQVLVATGAHSGRHAFTRLTIVKARKR